MMRTRGEINQKIRNTSAIVMTAAKLKQKEYDDEELTARDVDVVRTGTSGVISGMH